jgi:LytR cell envelope-related transcriptional attenuator
LPEIVQAIGAAAGLAAVVGLTVLSGLYFSQARDVKRLREWAGRAPERARLGVAAVPGRRAVVPVPTAGTAAKAAPPQQEGSPPDGAGVNPDAKPKAHPGGAQAGGAAVIRPRRSDARYRRIGTRYVAVVLIGLLVLGGAAAYGVTQMTGDAGGDNSLNVRRNDRNGSPNKPRRDGSAVKTGHVTVAILNGTTVPGLAATLRDQIAAAGFKKGTIDVFSDQQLAESVVEYAPGHQAEAKAVSRIVAISRCEPVTANSRALAGDATVIVIAGADKAP